LTKPYLQFPARLSLPFAAIIPREAVEFYGDQWGTHPVGTGPFKFNSWDIASGAIVLDRNFNYWNPIRTNLAGVHFRILKSEASQLAGFTQGEIDVFEVTPAISTQIFESGTRLNSRFANAQQIETSILKVHFVGLNFRTPVVKDKNFRLACNYAIDKEELTKKILSNMTVPANGVLPPALSGADGISLYQQDVNKARQLLKTSPYKGQELVYTTDNSTDSLAVAEYLQNQLANIGVKIRIDKNPESIWIDKLTKGEFDLAKLYFAYDYPSPDNGFSQFLKSNFAPTGPNFLYYTNSRFDALYDRALQQPDNTEATATFTQLNQIIRDDSPWIFLYYPKRVLIVRHGISGAKINPLSFSLLLTDTEKPS
jgi:peptide/nickel transport system substrate-binding protein